MCDVGLKDPIFCAILLLRGLSQTESTDQQVFGLLFFFSAVSYQQHWLGNKHLSGALGLYFCSYELLL